MGNERSEHTNTLVDDEARRVKVKMKMKCIYACIKIPAIAALCCCSSFVDFSVHLDKPRCQLWLAEQDSEQYADDRPTNNQHHTQNKTYRSRMENKHACTQ